LIAVDFFVYGPSVHTNTCVCTAVARLPLRQLGLIGFSDIMLLISHKLHMDISRKPIANAKVSAWQQCVYEGS